MFVDRNDEGLVTGVFALSQYEGQEELPDDHADIAAFYARITSMVVAKEVSSGQMITALDELGWLDAVDAAVAQADDLSKRLWARASRFPRDDARLIAIATAIGKNSEDLDQLFALAATK